MPAPRSRSCPRTSRPNRHSHRPPPPVRAGDRDAIIPCYGWLMIDDALLQQIAAKKAELDRLRGRTPDGLSGLEHTQDLELTYTSNAIEGNTLTAAETT